ncbi:hypothetical protein [Posidoniimonas corsicana]|nr:hypothetical protein [Posidoniimonas corsicana]
MAASTVLSLLAWITGFLPEAVAPAGSDWQSTALWLLALPLSFLLAFCGVLVVRFAGYGQIAAYSTFFCDFDAGKVYAWRWYLGAYKGLEHADLARIDRVGVFECKEARSGEGGGTETVYYVALFQDERPVLSVQRYSSLMAWRAKSLAKEIAEVLKKQCDTNPTTRRLHRGSSSN